MGAEFSYAGTELDALAEVENYYDWILRLFAPHLGAQVVEVGAGIGTFSTFLLRSPSVEQLLLVEPASNNFPVLASRYSEDSRVKILQGYLEDHAAGLAADSLVAVNVLEHVPDDERFLAAACSSLTPAGKLLLFVPAVPVIFGSLDRAFEHYRRYTKSDLSKKLRAAGFHQLELRHLNLPGVLAWLVSGRVLRRKTLRRQDVRFYDRWVIPFVEKVETMIEPPVGQSILVIASR